MSLRVGARVSDLESNKMEKNIPEIISKLKNFNDTVNGRFIMNSKDIRIPNIVFLFYSCPGLLNAQDLLNMIGYGK